MTISQNNRFRVSQLLGAFAVASSAVLFVHADSALAADSATFDVSGTLVADCGFESTSLTFPLGQVPISSFDEVGAMGPEVQANLVSTGCSGVTRVYMSFTADADPLNTNLFATRGAGKGVGIALRLRDASLVPNGPEGSWNPRGPGGSYEFYARYVSTGAQFAPGAANATITVNIRYE